MQHPQRGDDVRNLGHGQQAAEPDHLNRDALGLKR